MRSSLRSRWRSAVVVALIAVLCGGVGMAAIAGARRTTTAYTRFVREAKDPQVYVAAPDRETSALSADTMRQTVDASQVGEIVFLAARPATLAQRDEIELGVVGALTDTVGRTLMLTRVIEGSLPTGERDVGVNDLAAAELDVQPGDRLTMTGYSPGALEACETGSGECGADVDLGDVTVSGILRAPEDVSPESFGAMTVQLSAPLTQSWVDRVAAQMWLAGARVDAPADRAELQATLTDAIGADRVSGEAADVFLETDSEGDPERVSGSLNVEHNGLLFVALLAVIAGLIAVPQALARDRDWSSAEQHRMRALGWTQRDWLRSSLLWSLILGLTAGVAAIAAAVAMSPLFPIGLARRAEPSLGFHADWLVLGVGGFATLLTVIGAALLVRRSGTRSTSAAPTALARLFASSRPVPATAGRFLLDGGRLSRVSRTALIVGALGIAVIAGAATFVRSQEFLIARPQLYGAPWDLQGALIGEQPDPAALDALNASSDVAATAVLTGGRIEVDGQEIGAVAVESLKGTVNPTMLDGRTVQRDGEIVISSGFMDEHGLRIGGTVTVGSDPSQSFTIVGRGVPISVGLYGTETGAVVTPADFDRHGIDSGIEGEGGIEVAVRLTSGADRSAAHSLLAPLTGGYDREIDETFRPARILNFGRVRSVPRIVTAFAALLTLLVLIHTLSTVANTRRHDLGVLRALGLGPRQAHLVMWWHGGMLAMVALIIGLPLGVIGGRLLWQAVARSIDSVDVTQVPWPGLAVFAAGLLVVSIAAGAVASRRAVPHQLSTLLRSE
ncbi:MAG TPA: FtsX-like permease family protein [Ilumatobacteraceae bacterium]|nr:FtsX-like permease family protein [Ilumatobacteraceae bacterium]